MAFTGVPLDVNGRKVMTTNVTYDDLIILYKQYIEKYGEVPVFSKCDSKHNMPQGRIINRIIKDAGITYNDFLLQFGKITHVRTESKDFNLYLTKYKEKSKEIGRYIQAQELLNNSFGLPNANWFVKYCPDKNVKSFRDFVEWCGYDTHYSLDKEYVSKKLIEKELELNRPLKNEDICVEKIGFSSIVLKRLYGGLTKAKQEIGLMATPLNQPLPFELYKSRIDTVLSNISKNTSRNYISWYDIENPLYSEDFTMEHKTLTKSFNREGIDIFAYIKEKGFMMNPSNFSYHYTFDDGERVVSTMEYDFSQYLKSLGFEYNKDYFRDVMYKKFSDTTGKINCDYEIHIGNNVLYVEIAGIIYNCIEEKWNEHEYASKQENIYRDKMIRKEKLLIENNKNYIFLFKDDMMSDKYKDILQNKINELIDKAA